MTDAPRGHPHRRDDPIHDALVKKAVGLPGKPAKMVAKKPGQK
jgi:hypothetical protein